MATRCGPTWGRLRLPVRRGEGEDRGTRRGPRLRSLVRSVDESREACGDAENSSRRWNTDRPDPSRDGPPDVVVNSLFTTHSRTWTRSRARRCCATSSTRPRCPTSSAVPVAAQLDRVLGQPCHAALRGQRLLPAPPRDGTCRHSRRRAGRRGRRAGSRRAPAVQRDPTRRGRGVRQPFPSFEV